MDGTRSALLFARQVVLVEGLSEAILLRALAERYVYPEESDDSVPGNKQHREQFRAISVIPIGGVDFRPYVQLLLSGKMSLVDKLVVVTDGDGDGSGDSRKTKLEQEFQDAILNGALSVHACKTTFEAELFGPVQNEVVLRAAYLEQHPRSAHKWDALSLGDDHDERAARFRTALKDGSLDLGKGDFAQAVLDNLLNPDKPVHFEVPTYLKQAVEAALIPVSDLEGEPTDDAK